MKNGLYRVKFETPMGSGAGVIVLNDGRASGGDSIMYYTGTYEQEGDKFKARILSNVHSSAVGMSSVFGKDRVQILLEGNASGTGGTMKGHSPDAPGVNFSATLSWICD